VSEFDVLECLQITHSQVPLAIFETAGMKNRIQEFRSKRKLSMDGLAELVGGTTGSTISKLEKGQMQLDVGWLERLGKALDVHPAELIDDRPQGVARGFVDDVEPYEPERNDPLFQLITNDRKLWIAKTNALSELGIDARSILLTSTSRDEIKGVRMGDAVVLTYADEASGRTLTILRQYIEPRLYITNSATDNLAPVNASAGGIEVRARILHRISPIRP
jgi:transcriptional regulator with XRE-family HTH domain